MPTMTPLNHDGDCISRYVNGILAGYAELSRLSDLEPSSRVNNAFRKLVGLCTELPNEIVVAEVLSNPDIVAISPHLQQLCSNGEHELEMLWSRKIRSCDTPKQAYETLLAFPYHGNYIDLVRMELSALLSVKPAGCILRKFAILGSGPLPLTALCIYDHFNKEVESITCHNIDHDAVAISSSKAMCSILGHTRSTMDFECADANNADIDLTGFDVIYLAALVGSSSEQKEQILGNLAKRMRSGALIVIRSSRGLRSLLYPVVEVTDKMSMLGLKPLVVVHPYNSVINSAVIAIASGR